MTETRVSNGSSLKENGDSLAVDNDKSVESILSKLSLSGKLKLLTGSSLWKLASLSPNQPPLTVSDGPHGVRKPVRDLSLGESWPATCFPTSAALACSWNVNLIQQVGQALARECRHYNIQILLGPGMNLKRHAAGGRNFEYWSEDPYLTGRLAVAYIQGVQGAHQQQQQQQQQVGACVKHFAVNNQESHRFVVNAVVDERTARELYLRHFEMVVKQAQPAAVMCAYNQVNGLYCSEHTPLMTKLLRDEWGFDGVVMTDWGATNNRVAGIQAGVDLEMPGSHGAHEPAICQALSDNLLSMSKVDASCRRMLELMQAHVPSPTDQVAAKVYSVDWQAHYDLAYRVAMDCAVLLRNQDDFLPLQPGLKVALIGDFAREHPRYQGMGSSQVCSQKVVTAYDELQRHTDQIYFAPGYHADDDHPELVDPQLIDQAVQVARQGDVVILFIGLPEIMESEGFDRQHLSLPAQHNALVQAVCRVNSNAVVVLSNGGTVELPWYNQVNAILEGYLLGEAGGAALVDLIFGVQSPCGKLAETFPEQAQDVPADQHFPGTETTVEYREGLNVGYRYFDTAQKPVRYPFGHGLSCSSFHYDKLEIQVLEDTKDAVTALVQFHLTNAGPMTAKEVAQCYVHDVQSTVYRPTQELKGFSKIELQPGESQHVKIELSKEAFSFYDIGVQDWVVEKGDFEIRIGSSSRDIRLRGRLQLEGGVSEASPIAQDSYPPVADRSDVCPLDDDSFYRRFRNSSSGFELSRVGRLAHRNNGFHRNTLLKEVAQRRWLGRMLILVVYITVSRDIAVGPTRERQVRMVQANVENTPLRALVLFSHGGISFEFLDVLIALMNWSLLAAVVGFGKVFLGLFRRRK